ncbi:MAG: transposase, partial [Methanosarcina sp.]|nr:transposase [Methanosarcina sp.]
RFYWGEKTLWSYGYFASTIGNVSKETAAAYIRNQG